MIGYSGWETIVKHTGSSIAFGLLATLILVHDEFGEASSISIREEPEKAGKSAAKKNMKPINLAPLKTSDAIIEALYDKHESNDALASYMSLSRFVNMLTDETISTLASDSVLERVVVSGTSTDIATSSRESHAKNL
jgi:hypothetical protein